MEINRMSAEEIKASILLKLENNFGCDITDATQQQLYHAIARTVPYMPSAALAPPVTALFVVMFSTPPTPSAS